MKVYRIKNKATGKFYSRKIEEPTFTKVGQIFLTELAAHMIVDKISKVAYTVSENILFTNWRDILKIEEWDLTLTQVE